MALTVTNEEAIGMHLANITQTQGFTFYSGFIAALRDARKYTRRNQDTGVKLLDDLCGDHGSWLGAIGYMALLDQIGGCFRPKQAALIQGSSIVQALQYFGGLTKDEANTVYALRCAFAHDFSLFNINLKQPYMNHYFAVCQGNTQPVVTLPQIQWDGDLTSLTDQNVTWVNLEALGDLAEGVYCELLRLSRSNGLDIVLNGGAEELIRRYSFYTPKN